MSKNTKDQFGESDIDAEVKHEVIRQARWRMLGKFIGILVVLLAFLLLREIEAAKRSYDDEHGKPVVMVTDAYVLASADLSAIQRTENVAKTLGSTDCPELKTTVPLTNTRDDAVLVRVCAVQGLLGTGFSPLKEIIEKKLMYQTFKDDKAIIDRLDDEILAYAEFQKKALLSANDLESRKRAIKLPDLSQDEVAVEAALQEIFDSLIPQEATAKAKQEEFSAWFQTKLDTLSADERNTVPDDKLIARWRRSLALARYSKERLRLLEKSLVVWRNAITNQKDNSARFKFLKEEIAGVDREAQEQINAVYLKIKPNLGQLIEASPGALGKDNSLLGSFNPRSVLNESSGIHVVYQTLRTTFVLVLVFGLIFFLILLFRPVPYFSSVTDQLMGHAGELFKRSDGAGAQVAKSVLVTASALGIGAAVAVAGSNSVNPKVHVAGENYIESYDPYREGQRGWAGPNGRNGEPGASGLMGAPGQQGGTGLQGATGQQGINGQNGENGVVLHEFKLSEPLVYPSPITVQGPSSVSLDPGSIKLLVEGLKQPVVTTSTIPPEWERRISEIATPLIAGQLKVLDEGFTKRTDLLTNRLDILDQWRITFGPATLTELGHLKDDLTATKTTVEDLRANSLERLQNSGGRGIVTRTKQALESDQHFVTSQSLTALTSIMRTPSPEVATILAKLSSLIGSPPMKESEFMKRLRQDHTEKNDSVGKAIDKWKPIILKYTRMAY